MKSSTNIIRTVLFLMFTSLMFTSCVKKEYDDLETANVDPDLTATHSIRQLQAYATGPVGVEITSDIIIAGIVVADDSSGNIYKSLILQQDSSGIAVQLDISNFYVEYKVGRRIFVKCKGLFIANDGGNFQLGTFSVTDPVGRIPQGIRSKYLYKGQWGQYLAPKVYQITDQNIPTNTLVQFNDIEFQDGDNGIAWATATHFNLTIEDCIPPPNTNTLTVYSSQYSTFAVYPTPSGKGSMVGIYTLYNGNGEIQVRDPRDANMYNLRCDGSNGIPELTTLDSIRFLDPGAGNLISLPANRKIQATVTSDYTTNTIGGAGKNIYLQDSTAGIQIRFSAIHSFAVGTKLEINISNRELSTFNGVLQINNVPLQNAIPIGSGNATPRNVTISDINTNFNTWESQLVKIDGVTISGDSAYYSAPNVILTDASSNTIELYTSWYATFATLPYPTGTVSVTGLLIEYNGTKEIVIRNITDIQ